MEILHASIPPEFVRNLDSLLYDTRADMGFAEFDEVSSPQVYQFLSTLYFFSLGARLDTARTRHGSNQEMLRGLDRRGLITPKPKDYAELKQTFENLFTATSEYLS